MADDNEIDTLSPNATCHIDFDFVIPVQNIDHTLLTVHLLQKCIAAATREILSEETVLSAEQINISIELKPDDLKPRQLVVKGWISTTNAQRKLYIDALILAQKSKKLSRQISDRTSIKKTKITIQAFATKFSNEERIDESFIGSTEVLMEKARDRVLSNNQQSKPIINGHNDDNNNDENEQNEAEEPSTNLVENTQSVIVHDDVVDDVNQDEDEENERNNLDEEEYDLINKQPSSTTSNDNESFVCNYVHSSDYYELSNIYTAND